MHICKFFLDTINMLNQQLNRLAPENPLRSEILLAQLTINNRIILHFKIYEHCLQFQSNLLQIPQDELEAFLQSENEQSDVVARIQKDLYIHNLNHEDIRKTCEEELSAEQKTRHQALLKNEYKETGEFHRDFQGVMRSTIELIYNQVQESEHKSVDDLNLLDNLFIIFTIKTSIQWDP